MQLNRVSDTHAFNSQPNNCAYYLSGDLSFRRGTGTRHRGWSRRTCRRLHISADRGRRPDSGCPHTRTCNRKRSERTSRWRHTGCWNTCRPSIRRRTVFRRSCRYPDTRQARFPRPPDIRRLEDAFRFEARNRQVCQGRLSLRSVWGCRRSRKNCRQKQHVCQRR